MNPSDREISKALQEIANNFFSPNELDRNFEPANIVDALFAIARAIRFLAQATLTAHGKAPAEKP